VIREALLMMGQGGGKDIFNGLFVEAIEDFCGMHDLEEDKKPSGSWII
jgi:hypothetical protein